MSDTDSDAKVLQFEPHRQHSNHDRLDVKWTDEAGDAGPVDFVAYRKRPAVRRKNQTRALERLREKNGDEKFEEFMKMILDDPWAKQALAEAEAEKAGTDGEV